MITQCYSLYDKKAQSYATPFFTQNDATAIRAVHRLVLDPNTTIACNPEDFQLVHIGAINDETGEIAPYQVRVVVECSSLVPVKADV